MHSSMVLDKKECWDLTKFKDRGMHKVVYLKLLVAEYKKAMQLIILSRRGYHIHIKLCVTCGHATSSSKSSGKLDA